MNKTRDILKESGLLARRTLFALTGKENKLLEPPRFSDNALVFIDKIHVRAETVTPILKGIPGYPSAHFKN